MIRTALLTVAVGLALAGPTAPSHAAPTQAAGCSGVTVVVEPNRLGGADETRCAPGDPGSGVAALRGAGFEPTRAAQEAGYFVCRIDGKPADDPCQRASPEDAYWSYWHAQPGGTWAFSGTGAADYDPEPGTVEGWSFGAGEPPSTPPPAARQAEPSRAPAPAPPASAGPRRSAPPRASSPAPAAPSTGAPAAEPTTGPAGSAGTGASPGAVAPARPSPGAQRSPSPSSTPAADPVRAVADPATPQEGTSPLVGVLLAVAVLAALGAAAALQAQRRR